MNFGHALRNILLAAAATAALAGCTPMKSVRGQMLEPDRVAQIEPGSSTRRDVYQLLGTPTTLATFDDRKWIYVNQTVERRAFMKPQVTDRTILVVTFDDVGFVKDVQTLDETAARDVALVDATTPTPGTEIGLLEQLLGNIGRFNSDAQGR